MSWIAWEEGGVNWGKDTGYENPQHRIHLRKGGTEIYGPPNSRTYAYRRPRVAMRLKWAAAARWISATGPRTSSNN